MKVFLSFLLALCLSGAGAYVSAKDVEYFAAPDRPIEAVVTDEPCSDKVKDALRTKYEPVFGKIPDEQLKDLVRIRVTKFFTEPVPLEGCVFPKDEDGDYPLIDEKGREGYLIHDGLSKTPRPANSKEI